MNSRPTHYAIHGLSLRVTADSPALIESLGSMLSPFCAAGGDGGFELQVRTGQFDERAEEGLRLFWRGPLSDGPYLAYYTSPLRRLIILEGLARLELDLQRRRLDATVLPGQERLAGHCLFVPMICELLSHAGQHAVHAAVLGVGGKSRKALLLAGASGRGKTTTALALAKSGLKLIADDTCFVLSGGGAAGAGGELKVWGLRRDCRVREKTFELLPWLKALPRRESPAPQTHLVEIGQLWPSDGELAAPAEIVLLERPNPDAHRVWPVEKLIVCEELIRQNVHATDPDGDSAGGGAMRAITMLVAQGRTWRLSAGPDLSTLRAHLANVMRLEN